MACSCFFHCVDFVGFLFTMEQISENENLRMYVGIDIFENEVLIEGELVTKNSIENLSLQTQVNNVN